MKLAEKIPLLTLFLISYSISFSQSLITPDKEKEQIKEEKSRLSLEFARIATGNSFSTIGNYASIGTTGSNTLSASMFFLKQNGDIINIKASGGATQGIVSIFDEGELNSNVSIGASYNLLFRKGSNAIAFNSTAEDIIKLEMESTYRNYQKKMIALLKEDPIETIKKDEAELDILKNQLTKDLNASKIEIATLKAKLASDSEINKAIQKHEIINDKLKEAENLIDSLRKKKDDFDEKSIYGTLNAYTYEMDSKIKELSKKIKDMKPDVVSFSWFSFGYTAKNDEFKLFDETLSLGEQLYSGNYTTQSFQVSFNHLSNARAVIRKDDTIISFKNKKKEYVSIGAKFDYTNNLNSLKQVEIRDTEIIDEENGRTKVIKQNAFTGDYEEDLNNLTAFVDYYYFLASDESIALHFNPVMLFRENAKPNSSFQFGVLIPFKDKDKQTTALNIEVFYKVKDIFNTSDNNNALLNRNTIGIQASFPFNF
jgi:hypothetical protein